MALFAIAVRVALDVRLETLTVVLLAFLLIAATAFSMHLISYNYVVLDLWSKGMSILCSDDFHLFLYFFEATLLVEAIAANAFLTAYLGILETFTVKF